MKVVPMNITKLVKAGRILLSSKARHQLDTGHFDTDDLVHSIIRGRVAKKERDELGHSQYKYTIIGPSHKGNSIYSCGKVVKLKRKLYFIITFHEMR